MFDDTLVQKLYLYIDLQAQNVPESSSSTVAEDISKHANVVLPEQVTCICMLLQWQQGQASWHAVVHICVTSSPRQVHNNKATACLTTLGVTLGLSEMHFTLHEGRCEVK